MSLPVEYLSDPANAQGHLTPCSRACQRRKDPPTDLGYTQKSALAGRIEHWRRFRNCGAIVSRLRRAEVHAGPIVAHHRLTGAKDAGPRRDDGDLVTQATEREARRLRDQRLDAHVRTLEPALREPPRLERFLNA